MTAIAIKGAKAGQEKARKPSITKDSVASTSTAKLLYGLAEGEVYGLVDGAKSIRLDGTPLLDDAGNSNFDGVTWDFRAGTNEQEYIQGFPDVSNETPINVELRGDTPWIKAFTDTQLSAIRIRFKWNRLSKTDPENGDVKGYKIQYAIDLQTNGGAYVEVLNTKIEDKTSAGYERTHRIDLPKSTNGWQIRVRRLTANDPSEYVQDDMYIDAVAEVIDVKLRYPNTALLGLQYNAETFSGIAKMAARIRGMIIRVPSNYDAVARTYTGIWDGTFKDAYSNNPAWVYFDLCTQWRYGLGERLDLTMIDKWSLYALGQYCDEMVSDGQGGLEPRFTVNVYLQKQADAYQVLQNIGGIFRAMSYWNGEQVVLDADVPQDPVYTFSRANVIDGNFEYTGTRARDRHTLAKVAWDNPLNGFETEYEYIRDEKAMAKFGVKVLDLAAFGCTSQAQAQRAGLWALKTEQLETRQVSFGVGLDGFIPQVGNIINVSDELFAGRANGGRVSAVSDAQYVVTVDRDIVANIGDVLIVNGGSGQSERRNIKTVNGRKLTVTAPFTTAESENVWAIETSDLKLMRFRVMSIGKSDEATFAITAIQHEPQKYDAIDHGADVKPTNITIVNPDVVDAPTSVAITSRHRVVQGQTITTLVIGWAQVKDAVAYDVEWRKDDGSWIKLPRTSNVSVEIEGVYSGNYTARVRSVSAFEVQSQPTTSILTAIEGKVGLPPKIVSLTATGVLFGMDLKWGFQQGSGDADYTEIQVGSAPNVNVATLGQYSYPTNTHTINGLQGNLSQSYRARLVDKLGFKSEWSDWVTGTTDASADKVMDLIQGQIDEGSLNQILTSKIADININKEAISQETQDRIQAIIDANSRIDGKVSQTEFINFQEDTGNEFIAQGERLDGIVSDYKPQYADKTQYANASRSVQWTYWKTVAADNYAANQRITNLQSDFADSNANFTNELFTLAEQDKSIAADITQLYAETDANYGLIQDIDIAISTPTTGLAAKVTELQASTATAQSTADQAISDAQSKADAAEAAAKLYADAQAKAKADAAQAAASNDATDKANAAESAAKAAAALDAKTKADTALADAKVDAQAKADAAEAAATAVANAAQAAATNAATLAGNKGEVIYSNTEPSADKQKAQNLWIDTGLVDGKPANTPKRWAAGAWLTVTDKAATNAQAAADAANQKLEPANLATLVEGSGAFSDEFGSISGQFANFEAVVEGQKTAMEVISGIGNAEKLKNEIAKARLDKNATNLNAQSVALTTQIDGYTTKIADVTAKRDATSDTALKAEYNKLITDLTAAKDDLTAQKAVIADQVAQLATEKKVLDDFKEVEDGVRAQHTVKIDNDGKVVGFGLVLQKDGFSAFDIRADRFSISAPSDKPNDVNGDSPFMVLTTPQVIDGVAVPAGTYARNFYAPRASIDSIQIKDAAITNAKIGVAQVDTLQIAGEAVTVPRLTYIPNKTVILKNNTVYNGTKYNLIYVNNPPIGSSSNFHRWTFEAAKATFDPMGGSVSIQFSVDMVYLNLELVETPIPQPQYIEVQVRRSDLAIPLRVKRTAVAEIINGRLKIPAQTMTLPTILDAPPINLAGVTYIAEIVFYASAVTSGENKDFRTATTHELGFDTASCQILGVKR